MRKSHTIKRMVSPIAALMFVGPVSAEAGFDKFIGLWSPEACSDDINAHVVIRRGSISGSTWECKFETFLEAPDHPNLVLIPAMICVTAGEENTPIPNYGETWFVQMQNGKDVFTRTGRKSNEQIGKTLVRCDKKQN